MTLYMQVKDGTPVGHPMPRPHQVDIVRDGQTWTVGCAHWSDADLAEIAGILSVVNDYDPAFHTATGGGAMVDGGVAAHYAERPLADLKDERISAIKAEAARLLSPTDWRVIRSAEGIRPVDQATLDYRASIRSASDEAEAAIRGCGNAAALRALPAPTWPAAV